jgi:hypothetical protein
VADNYKVISQRPDIELSSTGIGFQNVWIVTYTVTDGPSKGTTGSITVPDADHNAAYIKTAIEDKVKTLDAIHSL